MLRRYTQLFLNVLKGSLALLIIAGTAPTRAQNFEVEGQVVSAKDGRSLPGVNIMEVGTNNGTTSDINGRYTLTVSGPEASLKFSFVGFQTKTTPVDGQSEIDVQLKSSTEKLKGLVVTALGIKRQKRSVGYATNEIDTRELVKVPESEPSDLLQGKVPGLIVNPTAGGPGAGSSVTIRGFSSISGDNTPLYIVDGIPLDKSSIGGAGRYGGRAASSGLSVVDPNNIESISVLKGASAAALYGQRARDGVILITTKSGQRAEQDGLGVHFNTTLTANSVLQGFSDYQEKYGKGSFGQAPETQDDAFNTGLSSWGAPYKKVNKSVQFDGKTRPYQSVLDRQGFYETGLSQNYGLSLNGGSETTSFRLSASYTNTASVVPNSGLEKTNIALRGQSQFGNLTASGKVTYLNELVNNRTFLNDRARNPNFLISFMPGNVPKGALQPGYGADNTELKYSSDNFLTNPYWATKRLEADDDKDRILGGLNLNYAINDWLSLQGRTGLDWSSLRRTTVDAFGTAFSPQGSMDENEYISWESNTKALLAATPDLTDNLSLRLDLGGNLRLQQFEQVGVSGSNFAIPFFQTISNTTSKTRNYDYSEQQVNSLFGSAAFNYSDFLYLTVTGRNDWSSTLPENNNSIFYPSVSGSLVLTDLFDAPDWWSYAKLRGAWAEIGGDTDPYQLNLTYEVAGSHLGRPLANIAQLNIPNLNLQPTSTRETEFGFETQFLDDRLGLDFTYYRRNTVDQILPTSISISSGYQNRIINTGEIKNSGVELLLTSTPISTENFKWDASLNYGANNSEVKSLAPGLERRLGTQNRAGTAYIAQIVGEPVNAIYGNTYVRDDQGRIVHNENGMPLTGPKKVLGDGAPDWTAGLSNTLSFKNVSLSFLLDAKWGGQIYSGTNRFAYRQGLDDETVSARSGCYQGSVSEGEQYPGCFNAGGVIGSVDPEGKAQVNGKNDQKVLPQNYYDQLTSSGTGITEAFVYDANFIKLRQVRIGYTLPSRWIAGTPLASTRLSFVARNLFYLYDSVPNVNPESSYNNQLTPGFEQAGVPQSRSFGFSLDVRL